jgi:hypothetical protein
MSETASPQSTYPEPPSKKRNDIAIELISGSVGGAAQVLSGQVSDAKRSEAERNGPTCSEILSETMLMVPLSSSHS